MDIHLPAGDAYGIMHESEPNNLKESLVTATNDSEARPGRWIGVPTRVNCEKRAASRLWRDGHETYVPARREVFLMLILTTVSPHPYSSGYLILLILFDFIDFNRLCYAKIDIAAYCCDGRFVFRL